MVRYDRSSLVLFEEEYQRVARAIEESFDVRRKYGINIVKKRPDIHLYHCQNLEGASTTIFTKNGGNWEGEIVGNPAPNNLVHLSFVEIKEKSNRRVGA